MSVCCFGCKCMQTEHQCKGICEAQLEVFFPPGYFCYLQGGWQMLVYPSVTDPHSYVFYGSKMMFLFFFPGCM